MRFSRIRGATRQGCTERNLDRVLCKDNLLVLVDGSTPLDTKEYTVSSRFVDIFIELAAKEYTPGISLRNLVQKLVELVRQQIVQEFSEYKNTTAETAWQGPSLAFAIVAFCKGSELDVPDLEYPEDVYVQVYTVGGCTVVLHREDIDRVVCDNTVDMLDCQCVEYARKCLCAGGASSYKEALDKSKPRLESNRQKQNTTKGYAIFNLVGIGDSLLSEDYFLAHSVWGVTMYTDGISQLVDTFHRYDSREDLARSLYNGESVELLLAQAEKEDWDMEKYPRLKPADDATWVCADVKL